MDEPRPSNTAQPPRAVHPLLLVVLVLAVGAAGVLWWLRHKSESEPGPRPPIDLTHFTPLPQRAIPPLGVQFTHSTHATPVHTRTVTSAAFTPDGTRILTSSPDNTIRLWDAHTMQAIRQYPARPTHVGLSRVTSDGRYVVATVDKTVAIWDLETGALARTIDADKTMVYGLAVSPDGSVVASGGSDGAVKTWSIATGAAIATYAHGGTKMFSIAFTPDGGTLATAGGDGVIRIWDVASGHLSHTLDGHAGAIRFVLVAPDGQTVVSVSESGPVKKWSLTSGTEIRTLSSYHTGIVTSAAIGPDGTLYTGDNLGNVGANLGTARLVGGTNLVTKTQQQTPQMTWIDDGSNEQTGMSAGVFAMAVSPKGDMIVTGHREGFVYTWPLPHSGNVAIPEPHIVPLAVADGAPAEQQSYAQAMQLLDAWNGESAVLSQAEKLLNDATGANANFASAHAGLARLAYKRIQQSGNRGNDALVQTLKSELARAFELDPETPDAHVLKGWIAVAQHDDAHALESVARARKAAPTSPRVLLLAAQLAIDGSDGEEAKKDLTQLLSTDIDSAMAVLAYRELVDAYALDNDIGAQDTLHQRIVAIAPSTSGDLARYSNFLRETGDYDHAIQVAKTAIARADNDASRDQLAWASCALGEQHLWDRDNAEDAKAEFEAAAATHSKRATCAYYGLGAYHRVVAITTRDHALAKLSARDLAMAAALDPKDKLVRKAIDDEPAVEAMIDRKK